MGWGIAGDLVVELNHLLDEPDNKDGETGQKQNQLAGPGDPAARDERAEAGRAKLIKGKGIAGGSAANGFATSRKWFHMHRPAPRNQWAWQTECRCNRPASPRY